MLTNDFMLSIHKQLIDKGISENTASLYVRNLFTLNNKKPFTNLAFLKKFETIDSIMTPYADSTRRTFLGSILGVLSLFKDKPSYRKTYAHYSAIMKGKMEEENNEPKNKKSKTQEDNWISWEDIEHRRKELKADLDSLGKVISPTQFTKLLQYFILCLFTLIPPRRNKDYQECFVVKKFSDSLSKDRNYYSIDDKCFVFNVYKTSKTYGEQRIEIGDNSEMLSAMNLYLKYHPSNKGRMTKGKIFPLLVQFNGMPLSSVNAITRILNKIFKRKVGASLLRHIYLSRKYGDTLEDMKEDSEAMGHSLSQQKDYILE